LDKGNLVLFNGLLYASSVVLTIAVAGFSYKYFESFFLKQKERFMIVMSSTRKETKPAIKLVNLEGNPVLAASLKDDYTDGIKGKTA
jgi:peptidoglycan/LPS O-acetylase OafA/YrhL